jgi:hypothetical protein
LSLNYFPAFQVRREIAAAAATVAARVKAKTSIIYDEASEGQSSLPTSPASPLSSQRRTLLSSEPPSAPPQPPKGKTTGGGGGGKPFTLLPATGDDDDGSDDVLECMYFRVPRRNVRKVRCREDTQIRVQGGDGLLSL